MKILKQINYRLSGRTRLFIRDGLQRLGLLSFVRAKLYTQLPSNNAKDSEIHPTATTAYVDRLTAEQNTFRSNINVHDLPKMYHYWSNKHLLPTQKPFGFTCPDSFFRLHLERQVARAKPSIARFVSIGAGNCDTEARLAKMLLDIGCTTFTIECLDINENMLARGRHLAEQSGLSDYLTFTCADFNHWSPLLPYDAVIANQSLHHVQELEALFKIIRHNLHDDGVFLTSDMIGRNGHMRWPEALDIVNQFWNELPSSYRYNLQLNRQEQTYLDWDCSQYGFEGIRAQDVLPLLIEHFHFEDFFTFANIVDPFIDRSFGHHFDPDKEWDRDFIDRLHAADEHALISGLIKPTHILAAMRTQHTPLRKYIAPFTPEFAVRAIATTH